MIEIIGKETQNEETVTLPKAREVLEQRKEETDDEEELKYEQNTTLQYLQRTVDQDPERAEKAMGELKDIGINEETAINLVNLMPTREEQIQLVFEKQRTDVDEEQVKNILKTIEDLRES